MSAERGAGKLGARITRGRWRISAWTVRAARVGRRSSRRRARSDAAGSAASAAPSALAYLRTPNEPSRMPRRCASRERPNGENVRLGGDVLRFDYDDVLRCRDEAHRFQVRLDNYGIQELRRRVRPVAFPSAIRTERTSTLPRDRERKAQRYELRERFSATRFGARSDIGSILAYNRHCVLIDGVRFVSRAPSPISGDRRQAVRPG